MMISVPHDSDPYPFLTPTPFPNANTKLTQKTKL